MLTNENGEFIFTDVLKGDYSLLISAEGYKNNLQQVTVIEQDLILENTVVNR